MVHAFISRWLVGVHARVVSEIFRTGVVLDFRIDRYRLFTLDRLGLSKDTVIIFTSDNGGLVMSPKTRMVTLRRETEWPCQFRMPTSPLMLIA